MIKSASVSELKQWLDQGDAVVIDVREPSEWAESHIAGAVHIPLGQFETARLPEMNGRKLVLQCRSGGRSHTACGIVVRDRPDLDAYNLEGGILAWQAEGYAVAA